jgi:hypothetical protein
MSLNLPIEKLFFHFLQEIQANKKALERAFYAEPLKNHFKSFSNA